MSTSTPRFLAEVARVLRPGGRFVLTDNRAMSPECAQRWLTDAFAPHGLRFSGFRDITANVSRSCELDTPRRDRLLDRAPFFLRSPIREMLGCSGTSVYADLRDRRTTYFIATADKGSARRIEAGYRRSPPHEYRRAAFQWPPQRRRRISAPLAAIPRQIRTPALRRGAVSGMRAPEPGGARGAARPRDIGG